MVRTKLVASFVLFAGFIVVATQQSVNKIQSNAGCAQWADGSPMPIPQPNPPGLLIADGSPMPIPQPHPPGYSLEA